MLVLALALMFFRAKTVGKIPTVLSNSINKARESYLQYTLTNSIQPVAKG
jgi:hypothetical protein